MSIDVYLIAIIIVLYLVINKIKSDNKDNIFLISTIVLLFLVLAIRKPISDMELYLEHFHNIRGYNLIEMFKLDWEPLYIILNKLIGFITANERFFMIIISVIGLIGPIFFIKNYSKNYLISTILFIILGLYSYHFFVLRQTIAISILLMSIKYIKEKNIWKFLILIIIASLFHKTSLVFSICYFICNIKITNKYISIWAAILVSTFILRKYIVQFIYGIAYSNYLNGYGDSNGYERLILFFTILVVCTIVYLILKKKNIEELKDDDEKNITIPYNMFLVATLFQILATTQPIISRMANIYAFGLVLLIPNLIEMFEKEKLKKFINIAFCGLAMIYALLFPTISQYSFWWL